MTKRKYELKQRAVRVGETRRRITHATMELHRTVGPAATRVTEVARRAGVQRQTVYNHFPDEAALLAACSTEWRAAHPAPDPGAWRAVPDPGGRLRVGLGELYRWYRETEPMTANVLRDAERLPALQAILDHGLGPYLDAVRRTLTEPFGARGGRRTRIGVAVAAATDFHLWRLLAPLGHAQATELAAALVEHAAERRPAGAGRKRPAR